jgi:hypothetical protein
MAATSPADGDALLVVGTGLMINPSLFAKVLCNRAKDFAPFNIVAAFPNVVSPNVVSLHPLPG